ncbi:hypothetical protein [Streptomyces sp. rh34]|uniref:hypothetical protein n=1 Tax=Streptomyces sp. rh34 TaxID=2034272 RepID=UPI00211D9F98|nr:hypothetical protein [Streptomyces sp. rh34]
MPRRRGQSRQGPLLWSLSAATLSGRLRGLPEPSRGHGSSHAPRTGRDVQVQAPPLDTAMPTADYHGAARP